MIGTTLSHYKIEAELGRGGMGIVYKAQDTKLDRTVALKLLPASALSNADDRARFYREAKAAAQLNHPNIAAIHEIDEAVPEGGSKDEPRPFIAMEYIDGESLEDLVKKGPMSIEEAVRITGQIASALEVAHEKHIVHRDIKTANVMMTSKNVAKVLDFGLAKTAQSTQLTRMGSTMGTIAYMSPEQAKGQEVDGRTDLWALGVIMYQLISGRLPFGGDYEQAITYSILNEDPQPLTAIRTGVPMGLEWIVSKLLAKNPADRYQNAEDLQVDLRTVDLKSEGLSRATSVKEMPAAAPTGGAALTRNIPPMAFGLLGAVAVALIWFVWPSPPSQLPISPKRLVQSVGIGGLVASLDISPNGDKVAFLTDIVRILDLKTGQFRDCDNPDIYVHVAFSADGKDLLLTNAAGISTMSLASCAVVNLFHTMEGGPRAEWVTKDYIVYEENTTIWGASLITSEKRQVIARDSLNGVVDLDFPYILPGGKTLVATAQWEAPVEKIGFWDLETGENLGYLDYPGRRVQWDPSGSLVFVIADDLVALPFDLKTLKPTGPLVSIERGVQPEGLSISSEGTLVHVGSNTGVIRESRPSFPAVVRQMGQSVEFETSVGTYPSARYRNAAIHPGGKMAAVMVEGEILPNGFPETNIWILDFETRTRRPLTTDGISGYPVWNSEGDSLFFMYNGVSDALYIMATTGRGTARKVFENQTPEFVDLAVSSDGNWAIMAGGLPPSIDAGSIVTLLNLKTNKVVEGTAGQRQGVSFNTPGGNARRFAFSPSGKYVAYEDQGGIYVQSIEDVQSAPITVWTNSMTLPRWAPDESMLYAVHVDGHVNGIQIQTDPFFSTIGESSDRVLNEALIISNLFQVFSDGKRFLMSVEDASSEVSEEIEKSTIDLHVMINISAELITENSPR